MHQTSKPENTQGSDFAIILAAGAGSRLGGRPKCLMTIEGQTLLERQVRMLQNTTVHHILIVTGFYHEAIEARVMRLKAETDRLAFVRNPAPERGQTSSVRTGIEKLVELSRNAKKDDRAVLMMLCDQPFITSTDINDLLAKFHARPHGQVLLPLVDGRRGNPCIFSLQVLRAIVQSGPGEVCRSYIDKHPEDVFMHESGNENYICDIDDESSIAIIKERYGVTIGLPEK